MKGDQPHVPIRPVQDLQQDQWSGCGQHANQVMAGVPRADRCPGHPQPERSGSGPLRRLFGR